MIINSKINESLRNEIKTIFPCLIIEGNKLEIVPEKLTHQYLLDNFIINKNIVKFYYSICADLLSQEEYEYFVSLGYVGDKETTLSPYPLCYKGAFINRKQMINRIEYLINKNLTFNNKEIEYFFDLLPYFDKYAKGFKDGFQNFEIDNITPYLNRFSDKDDYTNLIYNFLTNRVFPNFNWNSNHSLFWYSQNNNIINAYEDGKEQAYFYHAWSIVLSQPKLFEKYFKPKKIYNNKILQDLLEACYKMQIDHVYHNKDEDTRTKQILRLLPKKYYTKDQSQRGISGLKGVKAGSTDAVININRKEYLIEALNLQYNNKKVIKNHLNKLESQYDPAGMKAKFIIIYYNIDIGKFDQNVINYRNFIETQDIFIYKLNAKIEAIETTYTDTRVLKSTHNREGKIVYLYHILLKFPK